MVSIYSSCMRIKRFGKKNQQNECWVFKVGQYMSFFQFWGGKDFYDMFTLQVWQYGRFICCDQHTAEYRESLHQRCNPG